MHDIWNPWHGCRKVSEGCDHCYMYYLDRVRGQNGSHIYKTAKFQYPLAKDRRGNYKIRSGEQIRVCMTSDFFLEEADAWRDDAWEIMRQRPDVLFYLLTKRPQRVAGCLPDGWKNGWENIIFNVTAENQRRADERLTLLLELPFQHKGVMCAPLIGPVDLEPYLQSGQIEHVSCGGENYDGARPCRFEWVEALQRQCRAADVTFSFIETGTVFIKNSRRYRLPDKRLQSEMAFKSGMSFRGKPTVYRLTDRFGVPIAESSLYKPTFCAPCTLCGSRIICNGCAGCKVCTAGRTNT